MDVQEKLGVLIIGRKRPGFDQEWNAIMVKRGVGALREMGFDCIGADAPVVDDQTIRPALEKIRSAGCEAVVVLQPSLGNGQLGVTVAQEWPGPIVLWATPERVESETVSSCSLVAQHLWGSILRQANHSFEFVYGDANDQAVRGELKRAINLSRATARLAHAKVGLVGGNAPGFITMAPDGFLMKRTFGTQLHTLSLPQFFDRARGMDEGKVRADVEKVKAMNFATREVTSDDLSINSRFYLAMHELIKEESLDALAVQCWPEFANMEGQWPYLAMARISDEGYPIALEGDVDGAVTALLGKMLGVGVGFITDWLEHDEKTINFWHPGIAPMQMCTNTCLAKHFNIQKPLVVDGLLKVDQPVTITRLWRCDGAYRMTAFEGRTIKPRRKLTGNTALVEVQRDARQMFDDLLHEGLPHHVTMFFGNHAEIIRRAARMMGVKWI
jgi:L-fucose isomerase-like protein